MHHSFTMDSVTTRPRSLPGPQRSVLVAEDDAAMRELLVTAFSAAGMVVSTARNGHELVEIVRAAVHEDGMPPDVIVADVRMPGMDGIEALVQLRGLLPRTLLVVTTAFGDPTTRARAQAAGAACVVEKPFDLDEILSVTCVPS